MIAFEHSLFINCGDETICKLVNIIVNKSVLQGRAYSKLFNQMGLLSHTLTRAQQLVTILSSVVASPFRTVTKSIG